MSRSRLFGVLACVVLTGAPAPIAVAQVNPAPPIVRPPALQVRPPAARTCAATQRDCDGDGANSAAHGGNDCDDNDRARFAGNVEVADPQNKDEDCDASTYGQVDRDGDGEYDARFFNTTSSGDRIGGTDCDDTRRAVRANAQELPNRIDDDCNGVVDDMIGSWYTPAAR